MVKNKLFVLLLLGIFMFSFVSAAEFDNAISNYDEETETITFSNGCIFEWAWTCLGDDIGQVQLKTPRNFKVSRGYNYVWELEVEVYDDYNDFLKGFEFEDMNNGKTKINRDIDIKILSYEDEEVEDYYYDCYQDYSNLTNITEICDRIQNGTHTEQKEVWSKVTPADIKKADGKVTLRGYTEVQEGDYIDWSPLIFGVRVSHDIWATWTEDLNVDLKFYYKLNDDLPTTNVIDSLGAEDGTLNGEDDTEDISVTGKIDLALDFNGIDDFVSIPTSIYNASGYSISFWIKSPAQSDKYVFSGGNTGTNTPHWGLASDGSATDKLRFVIRDDASNLYQATTTGTVFDNTWHFVILTDNSGDYNIYIDGTNNLDDSYTPGAITLNKRGIGALFRTSTINFLDGTVDEFGVWNRVLTPSEVTQLWNEGDGITFTNQFGKNPSVTLTSPSDDAQLTSANIDFIAEVTDDQQVDNVTLYIDGSPNETDTSQVNGTYTFSKILSEGIHTWSILAIDNQSLENQSETRTFNLTIPPIFIDLLSPADASTHEIPLVNMSCTAYKDEGVTQLNLTINGVVNISITNSSIAENLTISQEVSFNEGNYTWGCQALNPSTSAVSSNRTFEVLYTSPTVELVSPINDVTITDPVVLMTCNATDIVEISNMSFILNGVLNETVNVNADNKYCFQESVNVSNQTGVDGDCGLNYTGDFSINYNSFYLYYNYTKPENVLGAEWSVKYGIDGTHNITIPQQCFSQDNERISLRFDQKFSPVQYVIAECYNGNSWIEIERTSNASFGGGFSAENNNISIFNDGIYILDAIITNSPSLRTGLSGNLIYAGISEEAIYWKLNSITTQTFNKTLIQGNYNWSCNSTNTLGKTGTTETRSFLLHTTEPTVDITAPSGLLDFIKLGDNETLVYNISEAGENESHFEECWYVYPQNTELEDNKFCYQETANVSTTCGGLASGNYLWNTSNWNNKDNMIDTDWNTFGDYNLALGSNFFFINYTIPTKTNNATWKYKFDRIGGSSASSYHCLSSSSIWVQSTNLDTGAGANNGSIEINEECLLNDTLQIRLTLKQGERFYEEAINWDYSSNLNCSANTTNFTYLEGQNNISIFALDEFGFLANDSSSWEYAAIQINQTFDENITEGAIDVFSILLDVADGSSLDGATFIYNDTNYSTSIIFSSGFYLISASIVAPPVDDDTNFSFHFSIIVDGTTTITESNNQTVINSLFDICGGISNDTLFNMSLFNERTLEDLIGDIEVSASIISKSSGVSIGVANKTFNNTHSGAICFSPVDKYNLYFLDAEIRYESEGYAAEFYHIQKADLSDYPKNISLFDLNQNDSTEFSVTYKNNAFIFTEGAVIQLQRKYIGEDVYRVVEAPVTGDGGLAILHIDLNTNKYRASVVKDGELLDFFDNIVFSCDNELSGDCTHSLDGTVNPNNDIPIETITDFTYSITVDEDNQEITVLFAVPSGTPSTINVALEQIDMFGNLTSCNTTIITSAGSITCGYTDTIEKSILELSISKDNVQLAVASYVNDPELDMDGMNFFIAFLFMISLVGMAIASPEWMILISVMVLIISGTMLLLQGVSLVMGLGAIAWVIIAAAIIIMKMSKQEDK